MGNCCDGGGGTDENYRGDGGGGGRYYDSGGGGAVHDYGGGGGDVDVMGGGRGGDYDNDGDGDGNYDDDNGDSGGGDNDGGGYDPVDAYGGAGPRDLDGNNGKGGGSSAVRAGERNVSKKQSLVEWYEANGKFKTKTYKIKRKYLSSALQRTFDDITIVTQCTTDRLDRLRSMALNWSGIISVAVYLKNGSVRKDKKRLKKLFNEIESHGLCRLDIAVVFAPWREFDKMYPINNMRNVALDQASTDLVFLLDVDFRPSPDLHDTLVNGKDEVKELLECALTRNIAVVIPAFEVFDNSKFPARKPEISGLVSNGLMSGFHMIHFPAGHGATDFNRWYSAQKPYQVQYQKYFEPYVICKRKGLRRYDERFRGYGMDKIIHLEGMFHDEFSFFVHSDGFITSGQHAPSKCWLRTYGPKKISSRTAYVQALYNIVSQQLENESAKKSDAEGFERPDEVEGFDIELMTPNHPHDDVMETQLGGVFGDFTYLPKNGGDINRSEKFPVYNYETETRFLVSILPRNDGEITIVTQCSVDRLNRLERMSMNWDGVISVAIYVRTQEIEDTLKSVAELFVKIEALGQCKLDISLLYENEDADGMYPINNLRNLALDNAKTDLVFLLDVDFTPSQGLYGHLNSYTRSRKSLLNNAKKRNMAIVVPAFEVFDKEHPSVDLRNCTTKPKLESLISENKAAVFASRIYEAGHRATKTQKWMKSSETYQISYQSGYEPYVICRRENLPRYDERFRGYGKNKIIQILALAVNNYGFFVMPDVFVVSGQHKASPSWEKTFGKLQIPGRWSEVQELFEVAEKELDITALEVH